MAWKSVWHKLELTFIFIIFDYKRLHSVTDKCEVKQTSLKQNLTRQQGCLGWFQGLLSNSNAIVFDNPASSFSPFVWLFYVNSESMGKSHLKVFSPCTNEVLSFHFNSQWSLSATNSECFFTSVSHSFTHETFKCHPCPTC